MTLFKKLVTGNSVIYAIIMYALLETFFISILSVALADGFVQKTFFGYYSWPKWNN